MALGLVCAFVWMCLELENLKPRARWVLISLFGLLIGLMPLFHKPVLLVFGVTMTTFFIAKPKLRIPLVACGGLSLILILIQYLTSANLFRIGQNSIQWYPGLYDADARKSIAQRIYQGDNPNVFCPLLRDNHIGYVTVEDTSHDNDLPKINRDYFKNNFVPSFTSSDGNYLIYSTTELCKR